MPEIAQTSFFQQSRDFDYEAKTALAYASMEQCHVGIGWLWWQGSLLCREAEDHMIETCHWELFGDDRVYQSRFRGWFHRGILTVHDKHCLVREPDDIPTQLYDHLRRRFSIRVGGIRIR